MGCDSEVTSVIESFAGVGSYVLGLIRGQEIAAAAHTLPACGPDAADIMTADAVAVHVGRVRITFTKFRHAHQNVARWIWAARSATLLDAHTCDSKGRTTTATSPTVSVIKGIYPTCSLCGMPQTRSRFPCP